MFPATRSRVTRTLRALADRVLGRSDAHRRPASGLDSEQAAGWLEAMEAGELQPPSDVHDAGAWDTYWRNHLRVGPFEQGFSDMMSSDPELPRLLARRGARTILCAGNGLSGEALSLALFGFHVTALDISSIPGEVTITSLRRP